MREPPFNRNVIKNRVGAVLVTQPYLVLFTLDGWGSVITTGLKGFVQCPVTGNITRWTLVANESGSLVVDVWKTTFAAAPPTIADTIAGSEKPTLTAAQVDDDDDLTTWDIEVTRGDVLGFNVDSVATIKRAALALWITPA